MNLVQFRAGPHYHPSIAVEQIDLGPLLDPHRLGFGSATFFFLKHFQV